MKVVCYTCITGGYDKLKQPSIENAGIDFICFTDNQSIAYGAWKAMSIPNELKFLSDVKKQRIVKICPHRYLKEYDVSIWVDGNIEVAGNLHQFIKQYDLSKVPFYTRVHPARNCIYDEAKACIAFSKDNKECIEKQVKKYKDEGYPKHIGMVETGVLLRRHNDMQCKFIDEAWATELLLNSHRDQLSFNYICWKNHFLPGIMKNEFKINSNKVFKLHGHGR